MEKEEEEYCLCKDCTKDIYLKKYVSDNSSLQSVPCTICLTNYNVVKTSGNQVLIRFCRFLIRYHLPEYIYNPKWGGVSFPEPFLEENDILNHEYAKCDDDPGLRMDAIQFFIDELFDLNNYPFHDLYYGYDKNGKNLFATSIKEDGSYYWKYYKNQLKEKNHYLLKNEALSTFKSFFDKNKYSLKEETLFFRARIGYNEIQTDDEMFFLKIKEAYKGSDIGAPPIFKATSGRLNRQGVSYLYLASSEEVAIGEIRPHPGHYVSLGCFTNEVRLKLADLRFLDLFDSFDDDAKLKKFLFLKDIAEDLSIPVIPDEQGHYLITQFISDIIHDLEYDGIMYSSSVTTGYNLLVFDSTRFKYIEHKSNLLKIKSMNYSVDRIEYEPNRFTGIPIEKSTVYNKVYLP